MIGRWPKLRHVDNLDAYARKIMVNQYISWRRRRDSDEVPSAEPPDRPYSTEDSAVLRALAKAQRLIAADPRQMRDLLPTYTRISKTVVPQLSLGSYPAKPEPAELRRIADLGRAYGWFRERPVDLGGVIAKGG